MNVSCVRRNTNELFMYSLCAAFKGYNITLQRKFIYTRENISIKPEQKKNSMREETESFAKHGTAVMHCFRHHTSLPLFGDSVRLNDFYLTKSTREMAYPHGQTHRTKKPKGEHFHADMPLASVRVPTLRIPPCSSLTVVAPDCMNLNPKNTCSYLSRPRV